MSNSREQNAKDQALLKERRKQQGLKRIELWIKPVWEAAIKALVEGFKSRDEKDKK